MASRLRSNFMKLLNYVCFVIILVLCSNDLFAKDLKIKVAALGSPLAYSYIYVNGDAKAVADSTGVATIPLTWLEAGDVISASFVGFNGAETIFDSKTDVVNGIVLNMTTDFTLDEIVVKADVNKLYNKYTKKWGTVNLYLKLFALEFDMTKSTDIVNQKANGVTLMSLDFRRKKMSDPIRYFYQALDTKMEGDTINSINNLAHIFNFHHRNFRKLDLLFRKEVGGSGNYGYMGIVDNYRAFTFSNSDEFSSGQYILYFDKDSGIIKKAVHISLVYDEDKNIILQSKGELEIGFIEDVMAIAAIVHTTEDFEKGVKYVMNITNTSISDINKKVYYRSFDKSYVEHSRLII